MKKKYLIYVFVLMAFVCSGRGVFAMIDPDLVMEDATASGQYAGRLAYFFENIDVYKETLSEEQYAKAKELLNAKDFIGYTMEEHPGDDRQGHFRSEETDEASSMWDLSFSGGYSEAKNLSAEEQKAALEGINKKLLEHRIITQEEYEALGEKLKGFKLPPPPAEGEPVSFLGTHYE